MRAARRAPAVGPSAQLAAGRQNFNAPAGADDHLLLLFASAPPPPPASENCRALGRGPYRQVADSTRRFRPDSRSVDAPEPLGRHRGIDNPRGSRLSVSLYRHSGHLVVFAVSSEVGAGRPPLAQFVLAGEQVCEAAPLASSSLATLHLLSVTVGFISRLANPVSIQPRGPAPERCW